MAADYARRGIAVAARGVVVTSSSSESYSLLFKLLCDPGDSVLVPVPSYPLVEQLAAPRRDRDPRRIASSSTAAGHCTSTISRAQSTRARAPFWSVSPNNPTGSILTRAESCELHAFCAAHDLALIGDEVFCDYPLEPGPHAVRSVLEAREALAISLGGLSKSIGLPQLKLGWMALGGPDALVGPALQQLEIIADTYLSVATPVQVAAARLLEQRCGRAPPDRGSCLAELPRAAYARLGAPCVAGPAG